MDHLRSQHAERQRLCDQLHALLQLSDRIDDTLLSAHISTALACAQRPVADRLPNIIARP